MTSLGVTHNNHKQKPNPVTGFNIR